MTTDIAITTKKIKSAEARTENEKIKAEFSRFILDQNHPCMMAQTVFSMDKVDFHTYDNFGSKNTAKRILEDLKVYIENYDFESNEFLTFMAVFKGRKSFSEDQFESLLWKQLEFLKELDKDPWDPSVSSDPDNKDFSFGLGGKAFYIVGLHPNSSRIARQTPYPALAFNLHWQFEKLRDMNTYEKVRDKIRDRDIEFQGHINPMLKNFGEASEAKQYSGKKVGKEWECPFLSGKM